MVLRFVLLLIVILIGIMLLGLMVVGWVRRRRRQRDLAPLMPVPALPAGGDPVVGVASGRRRDVAAAMLDRAGGLGFRGAAVASVHASGVLVRRTGEVDLWIPKVDLLDAGRATWTIDRVVEPDGLTMLRWRLGDREVDTYLRLDDPRGFDVAIAPLLPVAARRDAPVSTTPKDPA